jgi:GNAT superfamily N-acetyltransferase
MTAVHNVVPGRFLEARTLPHTSWPVLWGESRHPLHALHRSAQFWVDDGGGDEPASGQRPLPVGANPSGGAGPLMRRPAGRPAGAAFWAGPPAEFVEMRGPDELGAAHELAAEAFGVSATEIAPRRTTMPPEPLHLRTWGLFGQASLLSCALTVVVGDVMVLCVVATRPALHSRGLGSRLVRELHRLHEQTGVVREFVACPPLVAVPCFERLGYDLVMEQHAAAAGRSGPVLHSAQA